MLIKRYPNRKLYNTETKQYITLDELADYIRQGEDLHVIDHASGEDLTDLTLTQILFEQVKKRAGFLPRKLLSGLIQSGGSRISSLQRVLMSSLGLGQQVDGPLVDSEIDRRIQRLVSSGELSEEEGQLLREKLVAIEPEELRETSEASLEETVMERILEERGLATRSEMQHLIEQIENLAEKLDGMEEEGKGERSSTLPKK